MTTFEPDQLATTPGATRTEVRLSGLQRVLAAALEQEGGNLLAIYLGALFVLQQTDNPDRFALACHNYRELMDRILRMRAEMREVKIQLTPKVSALRDDWQQATKGTPCLDDDGKWAGDIDKHLGKFLRRLSGFFNWFDDHNPKRTKEIASVFQGFDPAAIALPQVLEKLNVDTWEEIRRYFLSIAHHGKEADEAEFEKWQYACERFLTERLRPVTFDDHADLDELIDEGEKT